MQDWGMRGRHDPAVPWLTRVAAAVGPTEPVRSLGAHAWIVEAGGRTLVAKLGPGARDEADGLASLGQVPGAPPVPDVILVEDDLLVTTAVDRSSHTERHDESLGRSLGRLHAATTPQWGGGSSWIGACRVDPAERPDAASFYGARLGELAPRCGLEGAVDRVVSRLPDLLPAGGPALLHGDLWWGNVLSGSDGRTWLVDPSVHGGHPEEDLAMLHLFGPVADRVLATYREVRPLADGWQERIALFQLYPLLVHAVLFGGGYRARAESVAKSFG